MPLDFLNFQFLLFTFIKIDLLNINFFCQYMVVDVLLSFIDVFSGFPDPEPPIIKILQGWSRI